MKPSTPEAFKLMMDGSRVFTDMEAAGMRIDVAYLNRAIGWTDNKIRELENELKKDEVYAVWRRVYGAKADLGSPKQLGRIIFDEMGVECKFRTAKGRPKTDVEALETVDFPFIRRYVDLKKLKKARTTYLEGIRRETVDGYLHAFFNLHLATTYRSSSDSPNFQNQPIRDKRQAKLIRQAFIPRPGHVIVEVDQSALEFRGAANFWRDLAMIAYASDSNLDIHRDIASECYLLDVDDVSKDARTHAKNSFVFPVLYGSYYGNCAEHLWNAVERFNIKSKAGSPLYEHLAEKGINRLGDKKQPTVGTFQYHVKQVEEQFNQRFSYWSEQKDVWWNQYLKRGYFELATGFVCNGVFSYNNLMNTPIQGPSFHIVLWSCIQVHDWLRKNKMRSVVTGQVHDSIVGDVHEDELDDYLHKVKEVMTVDVRKHWDWIVTPLSVEAEVGHENWFSKKPVEI